MPSFLLLSAENLPHPDLDSGPLIAALEARAATAVIRPWTAVTDGGAGFDAVVVRTTWDYFDRVAQFLDFCDGVRPPLFNPAPLIRWNAHKGYLVELADAGVPVVPTVLVPRGQEVGWALPMGEAGELIIKPAVGGGAEGVGRFAAADSAAQQHLRRLSQAGDVLVQPYVPQVETGERSLLFFGGEYPHALRKVPSPGDYRVQIQHGGRNLPLPQPSAADRSVAAATVAAAARLAGVASPLAYARADLVGDPDEPLVMELEVIEPELFLPLAPGSAERFADALLAAVA